MANGDIETFPKKRSLNYWHRQIGLVISLLVILLSVTGMLLNHTEILGLDSRYVESERLLNWYGIKSPVITSYPADQNWISHVGDKIYFNDMQVANQITTLIGAVATNEFIIVAAANALILLTPEGEKIERLDATTGVPKDIISVGLDLTGHFVARTSHGVFQADGDITGWAPVEDDGMFWVQASPLPGNLERSLTKRFRGNGLTAERVLLDLHSGRILGSVGPLLMDLAALLFIVLSFTGCWMSLKRIMALRGRNRLLAAADRGDAYSAADLQIGHEGVILTVVGDENLRQRLASMGVMAGAVITAPLTSVFENPRSYMVRGFQLAMRTEEAAMILLQTEAESALQLQKNSENTKTTDAE